MIEPDQIPQLRHRMQQRANADGRILDALRTEIRPLKQAVRQILPRSTTTISIVANDGGNNTIEFDPFLMQVVRVVDSYGQQLYLEVVSPTADVDALSKAQFSGGAPSTALGHMMQALGVKHLSDLSTMIPRPDPDADPTELQPDWVLTFRDLCEWAVLHERICRTEYSTDTLIVRDGLLRSKKFAGELFIRLCELFDQAIERARVKRKRKIFLVGVAKKNNVLTRYQLAMGLEGVMSEPYACYVHIPRDIEAKAYIWDEWTRGRTEAGKKGERPKFVAGDLYLVKFGKSARDPIWAVDVFESQRRDDGIILGHLLGDSIDGFPIAHFPRSLQQAHANAAIVDFDFDIVKAEAYEAIRRLLPKGKSDVLDAIRLQGDPASSRY